jgi:hypothetical protein
MVRGMTKIETVQLAIQDLSPEERTALRAWLDELEEQLFDEKLERDIKAGKFDDMADKALADHIAGRTRRL